MAPGDCTQQAIAALGVAGVGAVAAYSIIKRLRPKGGPPSTPRLQLEFAAANGLRLRIVRANGIDIEVAEAGKPSDPLVLLVHGWPEGWGSWKHQMTYLAKLGFHVAAPSMRGYGFTSSPVDPKEYGIETLCADAVDLVKVLGHDVAHLVGHDWGAICSWHFALLRPDVFKTVFCMSVPLGWKVNDSSMVPRLAPSEVRPTDAMREKSGPNFFYILYHNEVDGKGGCTFSGPADREYASAAGELHDRLFRNTIKEAREARGLSRFKRLLWAKFVAPSPLRSSGGLIGRQYPAGDPPEWAAGQEREFWLNQYAKSGFIGGVNYYRNFDSHFDATSKLEGARVNQPSGFLYGSDDMVLRMVQPTWMEDMRALAPMMEDAHVTCVPQGSHWIMLEKPDAVNAALGPFLMAHRLLGRDAAKCSATFSEKNWGGA
jgi:pimeloyl-ACP methyl ester carboxylesterase